MSAARASANVAPFDDALFGSSSRRVGSAPCLPPRSHASCCSASAISFGASACGALACSARASDSATSTVSSTLSSGTGPPRCGGVFGHAGFSALRAADT